MTQIHHSGFVEVFHAISAADRQAEPGVLGAMGAHFVNPAGTMREAYDAMTEMTPIAAGMACEEVCEGDVLGWWVRPEGAPSDRVILFIHGGAYVMGSARAYRGLASQLAARTKVAAFVLEYPLAPERPFPAAVEAAVAAREWLARLGFGQVALVGDSAGGALALGAAGDGAASVVAFSPWVDLTFTGKSFNDPATHDPVFQPKEILVKAAETYLAGADAGDKRASPLFGGRVRAPVLVQVGVDEVLLDDARRYAAAGGVVRLEVYEGLHHVFQRSVAALQGAREAMDRAAGFIGEAWG